MEKQKCEFVKIKNTEYLKELTKKARDKTATFEQRNQAKQSIAEWFIAQTLYYAPWEE